MNSQYWIIIAGIIAIAAISGLDVMFLTANAVQSFGVTIVQLVEDEDPCRLITCGPAKIRAVPAGINPLTGNTICRCPNRPDYLSEEYKPLYQVSARRKY